jgi:hypothetical protein
MNDAEWQIHATHELAKDIGEWLAKGEEGCIAASSAEPCQSPWRRTRSSGAGRNL